MSTAGAIENPTEGVVAFLRGEPERVSGEQFRAMADLLLGRGRLSSRGEVSRELRKRLKTRGTRLHERTIRRHLSGEVSSIPPDVEEAMCDLVVNRLGLATRREIGAALEAAGFEIPPEHERWPVVRSDRFVPLVHLWLHMNPGRSKRSLACRLQDDLADAGLSFVVGSLESLLSGKGLVVRREIYQLVLGYLAEHGLSSEVVAHKAAERLSVSIEQSLQARELVDARRFQQLCRVWQLRHREASARRLSGLLRERLAERGIDMSLNRLQKSISGKTRRVRQVLIEVIEDLLGDELPAGESVEDAVAGVEASRKQVTDLFWVDAKPIAALARDWLANHPEATTRQLAIRVSETLEKMGYSRGHNAIQPVLGGWKKKTRGFVYRAMLAQFEGVDDPRIPIEDILEPATKLALVGVLGPANDDEKDVEHLRKAPGAREYLANMREYNPGAMHPGFLDFASWRAEKVFGVPRAMARAWISGRKPLPAEI